mmetsp:Transcript_37677/g.89107  ORF Transcript_37677/g.89107 Transcript_37677/m.89107 type:complete len:224 (+) Transcript_37677:43-714(+)
MPLPPPTPLRALRPALSPQPLCGLWSVVCACCAPRCAGAGRAAQSEELCSSLSPNISATLWTVRVRSSTVSTVRRWRRGPWRSLFTMPFDSRSTTSRSLVVSPLRRFTARWISCCRICSALFCSREIIGTVQREFCQSSKAASSSKRSASASSATRRRFAWLAATTASKSSTLKTLARGCWSVSASMLRGTLMSTIIVRRCSTPSTLALSMMGSIAPVHVNTT